MGLKSHVMSLERDRLAAMDLLLRVLPLVEDHELRRKIQKHVFYAIESLPVESDRDSDSGEPVHGHN